jgi:acetolactate synthase-1/2/3 large subunit
MVRQWQELFYKERYSSTEMVNPDFMAIAKAFKLGAREIREREELDDAIKEMLEYEGPFLLVANVEKYGLVYPMVPAGGCITEMIY